MTSVVVRHNFEAGHRLPQLGGKCQNLHGHSWWAEVTVSGRPDATGVVVDFGVLKKALRTWIDAELDHASMLGDADPLVIPLLAAGSRVFRFGRSGPSDGLDWPTVENVALLVARVATGIVADLGQDHLAVSRVRVSETHLNAAEVTL
ncbi:6-pyruvoyl trahydropterin synthase family protein [Kribbella sp. CA-293567]|uniref:6-pyruvoyl trahydropterin synthase family protein n=1 Tax=Kribbella sp. CA-293567 TaxID=3002436 RepID=UPI0022DD909B|nr:6-carboxytetrahydropterin synthase [Kribbella sp. CA-293567]WBQ07615.1 6-carboxytetrahydropterin synthase [Kribbella sp. CA-293567]